MKLSKSYEPQAYEPKIYQLWESAKAFSATKGKNAKQHFSIALPPPNANGNLHAGHALTVAIEDVAVRYHRLKGEPTVFLPGADHAGFETWVVFERQLEREGKSRFDYPREKLYNMVWDFVAAHRGNMDVQLRQLGASLDWDNLTFTLDDKVIDTAYQTFQKMWDEGLIYRGKRLVNYCTKHQTGFADIEVLYEDRTTPLYYMKYGPFTLATTRPETKFGDTGVAVHPDDERYKQFIGKELTIEGVNGPFKVKVIADELVDPSFGTGVVKVTPAHSFDDFEMGERHGLPSISVIDLDGKMNNKAGRFAGMTVLEARQAVVEALDKINLLEKIDTHYKNRVGVCYKCGTVIEPLLLDQWFINVKPLAERAVKAIEAGEIEFFPTNKGKVLINYLKNLKDWNISRQTPWGISIPAFQNQKNPAEWIFSDVKNTDEIEVNGKIYTRDKDTFDTWFSSGQWPYITTDYLPNGDLAKFYPLSVMETGSDLLFPWVSRMIMLGLYRTGRAPFKQVYMHGMVLDEHGHKMSKSKGNVLNPQEILSEFGSDATRMGLLANRSAGVNQAYQPATVIAARNFANKIWNIARFIESKLGDEYKNRTPKPLSIADHWALSRINFASKKISELLEAHRYAEAYEILYHTIWDDVADWYVECSKSELNTSVLAYTLQAMLTIAHPFAPFVTETIWQTLKWEDGLLMLGSWPEQIKTDKAKVKEFEDVQALVSEARFISAELGAGKQTLIFTDDVTILEHQEFIKHLAQLKGVKQMKQGSGLRLAAAKHEAWLEISPDELRKHQEKLQERLQNCLNNIRQLEARLANKSYVNNAPESVVSQTKQQLGEQKTIQARLERELETSKA